MKKNLTITSAIALVTVSLLALNGCGKTDLPGGSIKSAEKNSFKDVTSKLDPGGNFYLYIGTEQLLANLSESVGKLRQIITSLPNTQAERNQAGLAFDILSRLIKSSGVEDISGFGMSSIAREEGLYHGKALLHHYPGQGSGFMWNVFGAKPHKLTALDMLPANSALAMFSDLDATLIWSVVQEQVNQSGIPQAKQFLQQMPDEFERGTGLKWNTLLESLGGEYGVILTLDDTKMIPIPGPSSSEPIQVPEPSLVIAIRVKDETVFNQIDAALEGQRAQIVAVDDGGLRMRTMPLPLPLPIVLRPSLATADGYLFLASSDAIIQEVLAVKSGKKPGLKSTDEFKRLSAGIPDAGNQFYFMSQRLGNTVAGLQQRALGASRDISSAQRQALKSLFAPGASGFFYSVTANTDEGWYTVSNGNQHPGKMLMISAAVVPGMLAAIAIPNLMKARTTSGGNSCINNLRQLDHLKEQWALENSKSINDTPTMAELAVYMRQQPSCPQGGRYTLGNMNTKPVCSVPGHSIGY